MGVWQILGPVVANGTIGAEGWGTGSERTRCRGAAGQCGDGEADGATTDGAGLSSMSLAALPVILLGAHDEL
ncbi:hypothetical protein ACFYO2_24640 [Streptomyces sp. NPDC006602]|uniref:hypothetical protein n=1 Tax=Streptomyces sp. NPDC006602 TaxID=3364751 RepID=UPI00368EFE21